MLQYPTTFKCVQCNMEFHPMTDLHRFCDKLCLEAFLREYHLKTTGYKGESFPQSP